jgi:hypothetical protein
MARSISPESSPIPIAATSSAPRLEPSFQALPEPGTAERPYKANHTPNPTNARKPYNSRQICKPVRSAFRKSYKKKWVMFSVEPGAREFGAAGRSFLARR